MQAETQHAVDTINAALGLLRTHIDVEASKARLDDLMAQISDPDFWNNQETAQAVMQEKTYLENALNDLAKIEDGLDEQLEMIALGKEEGDQDIIAEAEAEIVADSRLDKISISSDRLEMAETLACLTTRRDLPAIRAFFNTLAQPDAAAE